MNNRFFLGNLRLLPNRVDNKGNIYYFTLTRSLLLSVICEIGIQEANSKDKYYLNFVKVYKNSDMKHSLGSKDFSFEPLEMKLVENTARELLKTYFTNTRKVNDCKLNEEEIITFSRYLIDDVFNTDQKEIDKKIMLLGH